MKVQIMGRLLIAAGFLSVLGAAALACYNIIEDVRGSVASSDLAFQLSEALQESEPLAQLTDPMGSDATDDRLMPEILIDGVTYVGILEIPSFGLELPVISQWSNENAKTAPCRYSGSAYTDDMIICAHNYRSHFGKLSSLMQEDIIVFTDTEQVQYTYLVSEIEILDGTAIEEMESGDWDLTLFTCTSGGKARVTVRCKRLN